jgi:DNA-binding response OmpR family regulator
MANVPLALVVASPSEAVIRDAMESAHEKGLSVTTAAQDTGVLELAKTGQIDLLIVDEALPVVGARRTIAALGLLGQHRPWVGVTETQDPLRAIALARAGAKAIWHRNDARFFGAWSTLLDLAGNDTPTEVFLEFMKRHKNTGRLVAFPDTPFEGSAMFRDGIVVSAQFGAASERDVVSELIHVSHGLRWLETEDGKARALEQSPPFRARCLVVEDDVSVRTLLQRRLELSGYQVKGAEDGVVGLKMACDEPWDVIVADLNMPRLDGWGLLRALQNDVSAREASVLILSAEDNFRDTLKLARIGAKAYIKKTGQLRELLDSMQLILSPRFRVWSSLSRRDALSLDCRSVGIWWLLRTLAELDCRGTLRLSDELGEYMLQIAEGQLIQCTARTGSLELTGHKALTALLACKGTGTFVPGPISAPPDGPWLFQWLDEARVAVESTLKKALRERVEARAPLFINDELATLYARLCSDTELALLHGLRDGENNPAHLAALANINVGRAETILIEMLQRGILSEQPMTDSQESMIAERTMS